MESNTGLSSVTARNGNDPRFRRIIAFDSSGPIRFLNRQEKSEEFLQRQATCWLLLSFQIVFRHLEEQ